MTLVGADKTAKLTAFDELPGKSNYLIGNNPAKWHTGIVNYRKVRERGLYPGIDLVYYGTQRQLEYDFLVAPGAQPGRIGLKIQGARKLLVDRAGTLEARMAGGTVEFHQPVAYQLVAGKKSPVSAGYVLESENRVGLRLGNYDRTHQLVIDPILAYSTYLGGSGIDGANAIAVAGDDTAFVTGGTLSGNYPLANAYQQTNAGAEDVFVTKLSADGSTMLYSTYLGGSNNDVGNGIAVDALGEAYVTGTTFSPNFPVTANSVNTYCGGDGKCGASLNNQSRIVSNAFVTKLSVTGTNLVYSTYIGQYEFVTGQAIAVNANGVAFITGLVTPAIPVSITTPPVFCPLLFPVDNGFQTGFPGQAIGISDGCDYIIASAASNAYVMAISNTGNGILYSSYIGGSVQDEGLGIAADSNGNLYVTGLTYSPNFPTTIAGVDTTYTGSGDAFLTQVNINLSGAASLLYSTYLGGNGITQGNAVALDGQGDSLAWVGGLTSSDLLDLPGGAIQDSYSGNDDGFVAKLNTSGLGAGSLVYFRYVGGSLADSVNGIAVDSTGDVFITGSTVSPDFPIVAGAFQTTFGGGNADAFVTEINPAGTTLIYSSYLGGTGTDVGNGIAIDTSGSAYVAGQTCSLDFPLAHPLQANSGGNCDAFASKVSILTGIELNPAGLVFSAQSLGTTSVPQTVTLTNGDATLSNIVVANPSGAAGSEFAQTNTCPSTLGPGGTCTITVTFSPTAVGLAKAEIDISDSLISSPQVISLSGSTSTLAISSSSLQFGNVVIGATSPAQTVTATNDGTVAIAFSSITASGAYAEADDCTKEPLQPGTNCTISVTFTPQAAGSSVGALELSDNAPGSPQEIILNGTGVQQPSGASLALAPLTLPFGNQVVGTTSPAQTVTATNQGTVAVTISNIVASGAFSESDNCTKAPLQPNTDCTINVTFSPLAQGATTGGLTVTYSAPGSPQTVVLTGTGVLQTSAAQLGLSTTTLAFGNQAVDTNSAPMSVIATNQGSLPITFASITASGAFSETDNCTKAPLQPTTNCTINVTFSPIASGSNVGAIVITDNAGSSPQEVLLTGTGTGQSTSSGSLQLSATTLNFGSINVGQTSQPQALTATNSGSVAITFATIEASGAFSESDDCVKAPLQPGTNCTINVTFSPIAPGSTVGSLTLTDNAVGSPQVVTLDGTGTGSTSGFTMSISPTSATVFAGSTADFTLTLTPSGSFSSPVTLSCGGLPNQAACVGPANPITLTGPTNVPFEITSVARTALPGGPWLPSGPAGTFRILIGAWIALLLLALLLNAVWPGFRIRRAVPVLALALTMALVSVACGGGTLTGNSSGTPAGTYSVTVQATGGSVTQSVIVQYQVK